MENFLNIAGTATAVTTGGGVGYFFVRWLFEYLGGRMDKKADRIDAGMDKLIARMETQIEGLIARGADLEKRLEKVEGDLAECKHKHAESEAEVARLKAAMQGYGEAREKAQLILASERREQKK
ncbi:hypothetical protein [Qipengyuania huizhouensis]|uniref:hypothetical protein n=1 Tax=Qipengyuania huizhouensis TaxID=2867245 RepID=UPI001C874919|nr:hypothetical protein [Qipengyuania huizhouensis]